MILVCTRYSFQLSTRWTFVYKKSPQGDFTAPQGAIALFILTACFSVELQSFLALYG